MVRKNNNSGGTAVASPARAKPPAGGPWVFTVPNYTPALANQIVGCGVGKRNRAKKECRDLLGIYAAMAGVPRVVPGEYAPRRRVGITLYGWPSGTLPDPDAPLKVLLDGLKTAGLIVDDSAAWCDWVKPVFVRWRERITEIRLEDIP